MWIPLRPSYDTQLMTNFCRCVIVRINNKTSGKIGIEIAGKWKPLCGYKWGMNNGRVICRQLGFPGIRNNSGVPRTRFCSCNKAFNCSGEEKYIDQCPRLITETEACSVTIVYCKPGDIFIYLLPRSLVYKLTVKHARRHSFSDSFFFARSVTRSITHSLVHSVGPSLIHSLASSTAHTLTRSHTHSLTNSFTDSPSCLGHYLVLDVFTHPVIYPPNHMYMLTNLNIHLPTFLTSWLTTYLALPYHVFRCLAFSRLTVHCLELHSLTFPYLILPALPCIDIRLLSGNWLHKGRVAIYHDGKWGEVCDDSWNKRIANVLCKSVKYSMAVSAFSTERISRNSSHRMTWKLAVSCDGTERLLRFCKGWKSVLGHNCNKVAYVECQRQGKDKVCFHRFQLSRFLKERDYKIKNFGFYRFWCCEWLVWYLNLVSAILYLDRTPVLRGYIFIYLKRKGKMPIPRRWPYSKQHFIVRLTGHWLV